jgi:hypothetical protein
LFIVTPPISIPSSTLVPERAADEHKGAGHQGHAPPVAPVHQKREQKQQHPHRAGVEAIQQSHGQGEDRQAERRGADAAEAAEAHVGGGTLTSIDQGEQFPAASLSKACASFPRQADGVVMGSAATSARPPH